MNAEIVTVGDEILFGHIVDTNSAFIGERMSEIGVSVDWITTVGDRYDHLVEALKSAWKRVDVVLVTGGLGPTHDDITKKVFCDIFGMQTRLDGEVLDHIRERFIRRGIEMPESNVVQAMIPVGASVLWNPVGTAPGLHLIRDSRQIFMIPGVPGEMERLMADHVLPILSRATGGLVIHHLTLRSSGISESALFERIRDIRGLDCVSSLPKGTGIDLRITIKGPDQEACRKGARDVADQIYTRAGPFIYAEGSDSIQKLLIEELNRRNLKVAIAEGCTGGNVVQRLTEHPLASDVLSGAIVAENLDMLSSKLGLQGTLTPNSISASARVSEAAALGVRRSFGADVGLATADNSGSGTNTPEVPAGTLFVGLAVGDRTASEHHIFGQDRKGVRERMAHTALITAFQFLRSQGP